MIIPLEKVPTTRKIIAKIMKTMPNKTEIITKTTVQHLLLHLAVRPARIATTKTMTANRHAMPVATFATLVPVS